MNLSAQKLAPLSRVSFKLFNFEYIFSNRFCFSKMFSRFYLKYLYPQSLSQFKSFNTRFLCSLQSNSLIDVKLYELITQETLDSLAEHFENLIEKNDFLIDCDVSLSVSLFY